MHALIYWLPVIGAAAISVLTATFCLEILVGIFRRQVPVRVTCDRRRRIAVLVPAHDESVGIIPTLEDIKAQLHAGDLVLVVADNCTDDTAEIARMAGAVVVERFDDSRIGKGYALDTGIRHLEDYPPDFLIMVDADCRLGDGAIDQLVSGCATTGRPAQALYLMTASDQSRVDRQIAEFAWRVKNWARPLGLAALGLPCQLMGTGMAFPWEVIRSANLASGALVEDLKLGLELAAAGHPPLFCPSAHVTSQFAVTAQGADAQRRRWEQGHLGTIFTMGPRLLCIAITQRNVALLALALDLAVPPLSLLTILLVLMFITASLAAVSGMGFAALFLTASCLAGFATSVVLAWRSYGRDVLPPRAVLSLPRYILGKLNIYHQAVIGKGSSEWVRTDRAKS
jgi:cellulose synthase/poly-beta-1,6-N-acetylglucosamine synthase-like glycosyltransferase